MQLEPSIHTLSAGIIHTCSCLALSLSLSVSLSISSQTSESLIRTAAQFLFPWAPLLPLLLPADCCRRVCHYTASILEFLKAPPEQETYDVAGKGERERERESKAFPVLPVGMRTDQAAVRFILRVRAH